MAVIQRFFCLFNQLCIGFRRYLPLTWSKTFSNLVKEAGFTFSQARFFLYERIGFVQCIDKRPSAGGVRAIIGDRFAFDYFAGNFKARIGF